MASTNTTTTASQPQKYSSLYLSDLSEVKKVFDRFDANGDGKISVDELSSVLSALGSHTSSDDVTKMMSELDSDKDGFVNLHEFAEFCSRQIGADDDDSELREAFDMYDQDKNGQISASELHLVLSRLGERCHVEDCLRMIQSVDADGDGNVSFEEFRKMMTNPKSAS